MKDGLKDVMKDVVRHLAMFVAVCLIILGALAFIIPTDITLIKVMAIIGFIAAILIIIAIEWWEKDEQEYEKKLEKKEQRARIRTHI